MINVLTQDAIYDSMKKCNSVLADGTVVKLDSSNVGYVVVATNGFDVFGVMITEVKALSSGLFDNSSYNGYRDPYKVNTVNKGDPVTIVLGPCVIENVDQYTGTVAVGDYLTVSTGKFAKTASGLTPNAVERAVAQVVTAGTAGTDVIKIKLL